MTSQNRLLTMLLVAVLSVGLLTAAVAVGGAGVAVADEHGENGTETTATPDGPVTNESEVQDDNGGNETSAGDGSTDGQEASDDPARLFPVHQSEDWLTIEERDRGVYGTTGPSAWFEAPEDVAHVTVREPGASARIVGDRLIHVEYDRDAAPPGGESLYHLEVIFESGDSGTVELYASETDVEVGGAEMDEYQGVVLQMLDEAEHQGFERSPEGLRNYHDNLLDIKQIYESLMVEHAKQAVAWVIAGATNPVVVLGFLLTILGVLTWLLRRFGESLSILSEDPGRVERMRREIKQQMLNDQKTAADTRLRDVDEIGRSGELYWEDAFGVSTLLEMGELARGELPVRRRDGDIERIGGVAGISAADVDQSWIERVTRPGRLPSEEVAVSHLRTALHTLITEHSMGHVYRDAYAECDRLLEDLDETQSVPRGDVDVDSGYDDVRGGAAAGGDD